MSSLRGEIHKKYNSAQIFVMTQALATSIEAKGDRQGNAWKKRIDSNKPVAQRHRHGHILTLLRQELMKVVLARRSRGRRYRRLANARRPVLSASGGGLPR